MVFRVGQKVCCIIDIDAWHDINDGRAPLCGPRKGAVYVVVEIVTMPIGPCLGFGEWPGAVWNQEGFRPLVEKKTDISIFTALLNPSREPVS